MKNESLNLVNTPAQSKLSLDDKIKRFNDKLIQNQSRLNSGLVSLDLITGGISRGRITEVFDTDSSLGKSSLALHYAKWCSLSNLSTTYFDIEQQLTKKVLVRRGINLEQIYTCSTGDSEEICNIVTELQPDLIVVDSLASIVSPDELLNSEFNYSTVRKFLRELSNVSKDSAVLILNQSRSRIFKTDTTCGGLSTEQWADIRISLKSLGFIFDKYTPVGKTIRVDVEQRNNPL